MAGVVHINNTKLFKDRVSVSLVYAITDVGCDEYNDLQTTLSRLSVSGITIKSNFIWCPFKVCCLHDLEDKGIELFNACTCKLHIIPIFI